MRKQYLECGKIVSTHGVRGEVKVQPWCDSPEYLCGFGTLYLDPNGEQPVRVLSARAVRQMTLLLIRGYEDMDRAATLRGRVLYLNRADDPDPDSVFLQDLLGMAVRDADTGASYGKLTDVLQTGANAVYELTGEDGKKRLIPAIPQVVLDTDIESGLMLIRPLKGLFDHAD